jgi:hypothetical protein
MWKFLVAGLIWTVASSAAGAIAPDTEQFARHLRAVRSFKALPESIYLRLQTEFLAWIDVRVQAHEDFKAMKSELDAAGVLARHPRNEADELDISYVGFVEPPCEHKVRGDQSVLAIEASIYRNAWCGLDTSVLVYDRKSLANVGSTSGGDSEYAYYLSSLAIGEKDADGSRIVASGWVVSNCTSTWNGKQIRIDRMDGHSTTQVLSREFGAHDREADSVASWIENDVVTFFYSASTWNSDLNETASIARYRVAGRQAVREGPVALTRLGFIEEWLNATEFDPKDYASQEAVAARAKTVRALHGKIFEWQAVRRCAGTPPVWEVAVRVDDTKRTIVFRIAGERATELRMVEIASRTTPGCAAVDISRSLGSVGAELPW